MRHPLPDISVCLWKPSRPSHCWLKQQGQAKYLPPAWQICQPGGQAERERGKGKKFLRGFISQESCHPQGMLEDTHITNSITHEDKGNSNTLRWHYISKVLISPLGLIPIAAHWFISTARCLVKMINMWYTSAQNQMVLYLYSTFTPLVTFTHWSQRSSEVIQRFLFKTHTNDAKLIHIHTHTHSHTSQYLVKLGWTTRPYQVSHKWMQQIILLLFHTLFLLYKTTYLHYPQRNLSTSWWQDSGVLCN